MAYDQGEVGGRSGKEIPVAHAQWVSPATRACLQATGDDALISHFCVVGQIDALEKQQPRQGRMKVARQVLPGKVEIWQKSPGRDD